MSPAVSHLGHLINKLQGVGVLSPAQKRALSSLPIHARSVAKGEVLAREGDRPHQSMLVIRGATMMFKHDGDGRRQILLLHFPGDIPDLQSLHLEQLDMSLAAVTPSVIGCIQHDDIRALFHKHPVIGDALWRASLLDAALLREAMLNIGQREAVTRTAHFLCELAIRMTLSGQGDGGCFLMPITQVQVADALGLSTVHINRIIQKLRALKLVDITRTQMKVRDWIGLQKLGDFDPSFLHLTKRQYAILAARL